MPFYDFFCKECKILVEDEFFKIADEKDVKCEECNGQMEQVILKAPGLSDPGGIGQKWTNDGYQMVDDGGAKRNITEKWEGGKNIIRDDVHKNDPNPTEIMNGIKRIKAESRGFNATTLHVFPQTDKGKEQADKKINKLKWKENK
jgi:putative FmdB family regulatory protein